MKLDEELMNDGRRGYLMWHNNNFLSGKMNDRRNI